MMAKRRTTASLSDRLANAVAFFWRTRTKQDVAQGSATGERDAGNRTAATGGKQLDGINLLITELIEEAGVPRECIHHVGRENVTIPGFFRPSKLWDVVVVYQGNLLAAFEAKALCGPSFGNNYNNRIEEAIGSSTDVWTAYREGMFDVSPEPFVGYFLMLEEHEKSTRPVAVKEKHFPVAKEFRDASYQIRCEHSLRRMLRQRCYSAAAFVVASKKEGAAGKYHEPAEDLSFARFVRIMCGHVAASYGAIADK